MNIIHILGIIAMIIIIMKMVGYAIKEGDYITKRRSFIKAYTFPDNLFEKIKYHYPHLNDEQASMVMEGLRQYLLIREEKVSFLMPSRVIDVAWHEFILCTELYEEFCKYGAGRFLHHRPAELMSISDYKEGLNNIWYRSCLREKIAPEAPVLLPLLFALDAALDIPDGCRYSLDDCARRHIEYEAKWQAERDKQRDGGGASAGGCGC